jgi:AcrR family transcriptional regulator
MCTGVNIGSVSSRARYHHGDLRNALIEAAARLAAGGGPDAVTVRAAAREVGVTPTAAYRHFSGHDGLLEAAKDECTRRMGAAMRKRLDQLPEESDPIEATIGRLEAIGRGYVDFALAEPGLFRTAFGGHFGANHQKLEHAHDAGHPHGMLLALIGELIELGFLEERQRLGAEISSWSFVHGLSILLIDGPLAGLAEAERTDVVEQALTSFSRSLRNAGHTGA